MSTNVGPGVRLEIGHVLFIDLVGYSKLLLDEQREHLQCLTDIVLYKRVAEDLAHSRQWRTYLHDLGECAVKHGVPIFIVNLYTDEIGNGQLPEKVKQWQSEQARQAASSSSIPPRKYVLIAAAA